MKKHVFRTLAAVLVLLFVFAGFTVSVSGTGIENKKEYEVKPCHTLS